MAASYKRTVANDGDDDTTKMSERNSNHLKMNRILKVTRLEETASHEVILTMRHRIQTIAINKERQLSSLVSSQFTSF